MLTDKAAREKQRRRGNRYLCRIDSSVFRAVTFVVVITLFLRPQPFHHRHFNLPAAKTSHALPQAEREDAMVLAVSRDNRIFIGSDMADGSEDLSEKIGTLLKRGAERRIYLRVDRNAKFSTVRLALAAVRDAGVEKVSVLTHWDEEPQNILRPK